MGWNHQLVWKLLNQASRKDVEFLRENWGKQLRWMEYKRSEIEGNKFPRISWENIFFFSESPSDSGSFTNKKAGWNEMKLNESKFKRICLKKALRLAFEKLGQWLQVAIPPLMKGILVIVLLTPSKPPPPLIYLISIPYQSKPYKQVERVEPQVEAASQEWNQWKWNKKWTTVWRPVRESKSGYLWSVKCYDYLGGNQKHHPQKVLPSSQNLVSHGFSKGGRQVPYCDLPSQNQFVTCLF